MGGVVGGGEVKGGVSDGWEGKGDVGLDDVAIVGVIMGEVYAGWVIGDVGGGTADVAILGINFWTNDLRFSTTSLSFSDMAMMAIMNSFIPDTLALWLSLVCI